MNIELIESVDYDVHPRFCTESESWKVDESLITAFTAGYSALVSTGFCDSCDLVGIARTIFGSLAQQAESDEERQFVCELAGDVIKMVSDHVKFYGRFVPKRPDEELLTKFQRSLAVDGHYVTSISKSTLERINGRSERALSVLRENARGGKRSRDDLSINSGRLIRSIVRELNRDFKRSGVLTSLSVIQRKPIRVVGAALELSVPESTWWKLPADARDWPATLYAHVDRSVEAPKSIIYLTDVSVENGPTACYPRVYENLNISGIQDLVGRCLESVGTSANSSLRDYYDLRGQPLLNERFRSHFMKLPKSVRFNSHFGWDVMPRTPLEEFVASHEKKVIGPAGTALVFDGGHLLHRGGLIESGERVVLQVIFGRSTVMSRVLTIIRYIVQKLRGK